MRWVTVLSMGVDRSNCEERQARIDWMIDEFRRAQSKRLVTAPDQGRDSHVETATRRQGACVSLIEAQSTIGANSRRPIE